MKLHLLEFCLLRYHDGLQNQRSRQNDGGHPKQNPANNYGNRFSSSWSRQNKFDRGKPIKPPTCYFSRKAGRLISSCPEKWRVAPKRDGFLAKTLSLTAVGEDTPQCRRIQYTPVCTSSCQSYCHRQAWLRKVSRASREENSPSVRIMYRDASHKKEVRNQRQKRYH